MHIYIYYCSFKSVYWALETLHVYIYIHIYMYICINSYWDISDIYIKLYTYKMLLYLYIYVSKLDIYNLLYMYKIYLINIFFGSIYIYIYISIYCSEIEVNLLKSYTLHGFHEVHHLSRKDRYGYLQNYPPGRIRLLPGKIRP